MDKELEVIPMFTSKQATDLIDILGEYSVRLIDEDKQDKVRIHKISELIEIVEEAILDELEMTSDGLDQ